MKQVNRTEFYFEEANSLISADVPESLDFDDSLQPILICVFFFFRGAQSLQWT
jgi:hypothetical protein